MVDLSTKIDRTDFTLQFVVDSLDGKEAEWDQLRDRHQLKGVNVKLISGNGYLSLVNRITFLFDGTTEGYSVILKVPCASIFIDAMPKDEKDTRKEKGDNFEQWSKQLFSFHEREVLFYETAGQPKALRLPKVFAARRCNSAAEMASACLLMEDLSAKGAIDDVRKGLSKKQLESAIEATARFHAFSLTLPKEKLHQLAVDKSFKDNPGYCEMVVNNLLALPNDYFRKHEKALRKLVDETRMPGCSEGHTHVGTPPVLSHGDLWVNNIFYEKDDEGNLTDEVCAFLDWQVAHPDTGFNDVCRLIFLGVRPELKERYENEWIQLYYETFERTTKEYGAENPYTLDLCRRMFDHHAPEEVNFTLMILGLECQKKELDEKVRDELIERMIAAFEPIREKYEYNMRSE